MIELVDMLNKAVADFGGVDNAIHHCDRMYNAEFRSEPFKLSELENFEQYTDEFIGSLAIRLYELENGTNVPDYSCNCDYDSCGCDIEHEMFMNAVYDNFNQKFPDFELPSDTLIVDIVNYKGEGEALALYELKKNLPVFVDKNTSFYQV